MADQTVRLKCLDPRPMAASRLLLIPYAGGGPAVYRDWPRLLPSAIEPFALHFPGREDRLDDPPFTEYAPALAAALSAMRALPCSPLAIYGHSLGAVFALDLARRLEGERPGAVKHVFCAARPWPGRPQAAEAGAIADLDDDAVVSAMAARYGCVHPALADPEIRELALPALRADLKLLDTYIYRSAPKLASALTIYASPDDPITANANLADWEGETTARFDIVEIAGGHFFNEKSVGAVTADIANRVQK